ERLKDVAPHALLRPSNEAIVERLAWSVFRRRIDPASAGLQHLHDPADHATIIYPRLAACIGRQVLLDFGKLRVRQPKLIPTHSCFLSEAVNHNDLIMPTFLWVWTLTSGFVAPSFTASPTPDFIRST